MALRFLLDRSAGDDSAALGLPLDDGWIHLVYARSLGALEGFAYNPGQQEAGCTSPLWVTLLAPLFWLRLPWDVPLIVVVKIVGALTSWVASLFACRLGARLAGPGCGLLLGAMVIVDPWLAFGAVSGMEVPLAAATMLAAFDFALAGRWRAAGIALGLAVWSRPECLVVAATLTAVLAWHVRAKHADRRSVREIALPPVVAAALWSIWCVSVTGRLLPGGFYVKHQDGPLEAFADLPRVFVDQLFDAPWFYAGGGLLLLAVGAVRLWRRGPRPEVSRALLIAAPAWMIGIAWAHRINEPFAFYYHRYLDPGMPLLLVPVAVGLWYLLVVAWSTVRRTKVATPLRVLATLAALPLLALATWRIPESVAAHARMQALSARNVQDMQVSLAVWMRLRTEPGEWLMTHDAGAIRFVSDRPVLDMLGINDHRVLDGSLARVIEEHPPRFVAVIPTWYPDLVRDPRVREVHRVRARDYVICLECDQDEMVVLEPVGRER